MFQDIYPKKYHLEYNDIRPDAGDKALIYQRGQVLLHPEEQEAPEIGEVIKAGYRADDFQYGFAIDEEKYFVWRGTVHEENSPEDMEWIPVSKNRVRAGKEDYRIFAIAMGSQLAGWYRKNRFCGACGSEMGLSHTERAHICPECGLIVYPRICPVVIVGVTDGNRLLLTKYADRPSSGYALIAGFMELGETPEEAVCREVYEEVGLHVKNVRYYKSQPWPYPDSLLLGFYAEVDGSREVHLIDGELKEGTWFEREDVPEQSSRFALTANLIEDFRLGLE